MGDHALALRERAADQVLIDRIRSTIEHFHQVDPRYLVVAAAVRESLASSSAGIPVTALRPAASLGVVAAARTENAVEGPERDAKRMVDDVARALDLPFVGSDLRAVAEWPDYLDLAWQDLRGQLRSAPFRHHSTEIASIARAGVHELPRLKLEGYLRGGRVTMAEQRQIRNVVDAFGGLLPPLVQCIALARVGLNLPKDHELLVLEAAS